MTKGQLIPFDVALRRENKRLEERKRREENARKKLMPLIMIVCETYQIQLEDLLDSSNYHPTITRGRELVRLIGYRKLHVGPTYLAVVLQQHRIGSSNVVGRARKKYETSPEFRAIVDAIEARIDALRKAP